jgi:serine protease AprX
LRATSETSRRLGVLTIAVLAILATAGVGAASAAVVPGAAARVATTVPDATGPATTVPDATGPNGTVSMSNWLSTGTDESDPATDEGSLPWIGAMLHVPQVWSAGYTGQGVDVALIDSGVAPVEGLDSGNVVDGPDLSFEAGYPEAAHRDTYGHGTHMASIIVGRDQAGPPASYNAAGRFTGIAPDARIISLKVATATGTTDVTQVIAAIDWVVKHAHDGGRNIRVLNLSYGTDSVQPAGTDPLSYAVERAWRAGIVVVAAAGNDGTTRQQLADPASNPYVLSVGADDPHGTLSPADDTVADFAQRGTSARHVDIIAPGVHVLGLTVPNGYVDQNHPEGKVGTRYLRGSGTSQSTAVVSGVAALVAQRYPNATPDQVKYLIDRSGFDLTEGTSTTTAERQEDLWQGYGVLDAARALAGDPALAPVQSWPAATGTGTLEGARGTSHVAMGDDVLTGEQDVFGRPWTGTLDGDAWVGETDWTGTSWESRTWVSRTWVSGSWDSRTWVSDDWASRTWVSRTWVSGSWSSRTWVSRTWVVGAWS